MKKTFLTLLLASATCIGASAQRTLTDIAQSAKFGGYFVGQYTASDDAASDKGFGLRYARLYVNGSIYDDFKYRLQIETCGEPGTSGGTRVLDAYGEWVKYKGFQVRFGQMKRCFTFENPYNPWDIGMGSNAQVIRKLAGMSDRVGEHSSGGRDAGLVIQGDLFPINDLRFLHYQIGVYNGQGINKRDVAQARSKDIIGGLWVNPMQGLSVGAFGWTGKYYNSSTGETYRRNRLAYGFKYEGDWSFRGEYISSQGGAPKLGDKADGWYLLAGAPIGEQLRIYGKWDVYREEKSHATQTTQWCTSAEWWFCKNLKLQANYHFTEKGKELSGDRFYNTAEVQLYIRF